jgi:hypothetical protein
VRPGIRRALVGGVLMLGMLGGLAGSASAAPVARGGAVLDRIAVCESGMRNVPNSSGASSAQGYWQIIRGTWRAYHGTQFAPTAMGASYAEQRIVAQRVMAGQGLGAWSSSRHCWGR